MKYTIELKSYSFDELRDLEEEFELTLHNDIKEEHLDEYLSKYRFMKLCFWKGLITDHEYGGWVFNIFGGEDHYIDDDTDVSYVDLAENLFGIALERFEASTK